MIRFYDNIFQLILEIASFLLLVFLFFDAALHWAALPQIIPTHFNAAGEIDGYGGRGMAWMMPAVGAVLYGLLTGVMRFPQLWNLPVRLTLQNQSLVYSATRTMLCSLKLVLVGSFAIINRHILSGNPLPAWFTGVSLGIIFLPVLVYLIWIIKKTKEFSREE